MWRWWVLGIGGGTLATVATFALAAGSGDDRGGKPIRPVDSPTRGTRGGYVLARGSYEDGARYSLVISRDSFTAGGITEHNVCIGLEPGASMCGPVQQSTKEPLDVNEQVSDCEGTVVFGGVRSAATRVRVYFPKGKPYRAHLLAVPSQVRKHAKVFLMQINGKHYARRVVATDRRGNVIGRYAFGPRDSVVRC